MEYVLMNGDRETLYLDLDEGILQVLDNQFLPYPLKDFVKTTGEKDFRHSIVDIQDVTDYLTGRMLSLERKNAKAILNAGHFPQSSRASEKLKIVYACRGLTMEDNFWLKKPDENIQFADVDLRKNHLSDASYDIAILGRPVSATRKEIRPDIGTNGMFPKFWRRTNGTVELWKTDRTNGANSLAEVKASAWLKSIGIPSAEYRQEEIDGQIFSVSSCFTNDRYSLATAQEISDHCFRTGRDFSQFVSGIPAFNDMAVADYILANTDRHNENWGFLIDNKTNEISSFAPLYDHNQCLLADEFNTDISDLIYQPTDKPFIDSINLAEKGTIDWSIVKTEGLSQEAEERLRQVKEAYLARQIQHGQRFRSLEDDIAHIRAQAGGRSERAPERHKETSLISHKKPDDIDRGR